MKELLTYTNFEIGSQEGANRSHAYYEYIAYYTKEENTNNANYLGNNLSSI